MNSDEEECSVPRKNIFQLVEENYDVKSEIEKINELFSMKYYFAKDYLDGLSLEGVSFERIIEDYLFDNWKYRGTCISIEEYFSCANADIDSLNTITEEEIINNLEVMENFVKLYFDNKNKLYREYQVSCYTTFKTVFCELLNTLERKMGLVKRKYKDKVILYPKNAPLEKVVDLCDDEDVQWELIRYVREDLSLYEKRKALACLATNLNIEDSDEKDEDIKKNIGQAKYILNNLHIRHNNKTGKFESKALKGLSETVAMSLCDMAYNVMLIIMLLRDNEKYKPAYNEYRDKKRDEKAIKKAEEN